MFNQDLFEKGNKKLRVLSLLFLITVIKISVVFADTSETESILSSIDTMVSMNDPLTNYGGYTEMIVSKSDNQFIGVHDAYIQFDLTELPQGVTVTSAVLILRASEGKGGTQDVSVYSCGNKQWDEYTSTWMDFQDMTLQLLDTVTIPYLSEFEWDITEAVKSALGQEFFTLKVSSESWTTGWVKFYSREGETLSTLLKIEWPRISVRYTVPDTTPPGISEVVNNPREPSKKDKITIIAQVTDDESEIEEVTLKYRVNSGTWTTKTMVKSTSENNNYLGTISSQDAGDKVSYYIEAQDVAGNEVVSPSYTYSVKEDPKIPGFPVQSIILGLFISYIVTRSSKM